MRATGWFKAFHRAMFICQRLPKLLATLACLTPQEQLRQYLAVP
jgi:hypothetical protein